MNKRAALELSVQSIVVFVLAFIVMGLIIGVIQMMFGQITDQVSLIPTPGVELGGNPTADRPLLVQNGEVNIPRGRETSAFFGIYYTLEQDAELGELWELNIPDECSGFDGDVTLQIQRDRFRVDRNVTLGDVLKFQTNVQIEDWSGIQRQDSFTCELEVTKDGASSPFAYGTFILNIV